MPANRLRTKTGEQMEHEKLKEIFNQYKHNYLLDGHKTATPLMDFNNFKYAAWCIENSSPVEPEVIKKPAGHYLYFRKKPVVIEAVRVKEILGYWHQWSKLPEWVRSNYDAGKLLSKESGIELGVKTLEGYLTAGYNDWIIKGVKGEIYPIEETIFLETYEPVSL